ncbi:hypothetical protein KDM87_14395 [Undibacterium sp. FT147W]|uniref:Bacteriophage protein n=1 Tax=Undibacterium rivi TaxID=2828729 RepID=A0ABS5H4G3_9BURK|nr:hypothetical protein [Undibacterium rivi]MBR7793786.1 hypothetical protein [Undibacterium rivi]
MTAAMSDRNTVRRDGSVYEHPVKAGAKIYGGTIVAIDPANNLAIAGKTAVGLKAAGVAQAFTDNTAGADGDIRVRVFRGPENVYRFSNSGGADLITLGDIQSDCYIVDDSTVAKTSGTNTRSVAGKIRDVDVGGVWVEF